MTPVLIIIAFELGAALGGLAVWLASRRSPSPVEAPPVEVATPEPGAASWLEEKTARRLVVHTTDDRSIEGLLEFVGPDGVTLRAARLMAKPPVDLGGEIWLPRETVAFVQTVPAASVIDIAEASVPAAMVP